MRLSAQALRNTVIFKKHKRIYGNRETYYKARRRSYKMQLYLSKNVASLCSLDDSFLMEIFKKIADCNKRIQQAHEQSNYNVCIDDSGVKAQAFIKASIRECCERLILYTSKCKILYYSDLENIVLILTLREHKQAKRGKNIKVILFDTYP